MIELGRERKLKLNPYDASEIYFQTIVSRGKTYKEMEQYEKALANFNRAIKLNPDSTDVMERRGETYRLMGRHREAEFDFSRVKSLKKVEPIVVQGMVHLQMGPLEALDKALDKFNLAIEQYPNYAWAFVIRGEFYKSKKLYDKAEDDFTHAIKLQPDYALAFGLRGKFYESKGRSDKAREDFDRAIELEPELKWILGRE